MYWEFGTGRCKLLYIEWINNKVLLYGTGNYIQYPVINQMEKNTKKNVCMYVYIDIYTHTHTYKLNHFVVQQKLTRHCKSTILQ